MRRRGELCQDKDPVTDILTKRIGTKRIQLLRRMIVFERQQNWERLTLVRVLALVADTCRLCQRKFENTVLDLVIDNIRLHVNRGVGGK